ncbi:protein phtf isoform X2 [Anopheles bellator]|uniref:protein phtf isoform X2 n=1 Tax=Anopheles bellator TaxID=139047 RepID=UPI002648681D|nr:protein phtf isoform X2 [Anopheles bellator]
MRLDALVAWYQKKIGTYDKQQWEKTIEQKILAGITHLPLKNTKLKTELIDVDLVRGSTFPKAKSKLSILTVLYLGALRFLLLPVYARWWVQQTSPGVFLLLLVLYLLQMLNLGIYSYRVRSVGPDEAAQIEHIVTMADFLIPLALSLLLSVIHSQIVATASNSNGSSMFSCGNLSQKFHSHASPARHSGTGPPMSSTTFGSNSSRKQREQRLRRKRRVRAQSETTQSSAGKAPSEERHARKAFASVGGSKSATSSPARTVPKKGACSTSSSTSSDAVERKHLEVNGASSVGVSPLAQIMTHDVPAASEPVEDPVSHRLRELSGTPPVELSEQEQGEHADYSPPKGDASPTASDQVGDEILNLPVGLRRRNVNWDPTVPERAAAAPSVVDDDGFESLNGKSSGGEDSAGHVFGGEKASYQRKFPFTNDWINGSGVVVDPKDRALSDSDTDTLKNSNTGQSSPVTGSTRGGTDQHDRSLRPNHQQLGASATSSAVPCFTKELKQKMDKADRRPKDSNEECSYSSELDNSDTQNERSDDEYELEDAPTIILNPSCGATDRVSCTIWEAREAKKAEMSVLDISSAIIERVEAMPESCDYVYIGVILSVFLSLVPAFCRLCEATVDSTNSTEVNFLDMPLILLEKASFSLLAILRFAFGDTTWERFVLVLSFLLRLILTFLVFLLLTVAERTFKQRFLYAKLFSHLTSSRRAQKSAIPHFRLKTVRHIKTWLCVRSYLKRRGPQNSVEVIVSAVFIITLLLLAFLSVEWLKDSVHLHSQFNLEALAWSCAFGTFLLRFMTLGTKINKKYKSVSVLITEQINLYVQIEQKPNKKDELMISNNVLKLAADLLKELESPFKISGLSANPYLYTTVKVVILSALSGVLSEMLGFKLKLHKIKIK